MSGRTPPAAGALAGLWTGLLDAGLGAALIGLALAAWAPAQDLPWTPLRLSDPPGLATGPKFEIAARDPRRCRAVLREGGVALVDQPARREGSCHIVGAVRVVGGTTPLSPPQPVMTCPEALAYAFWVRHAVQPAARLHLEAEVVRIDHFGTYACRNVRGGTALSQHAFANALDAAAFVTRDGRRISVAADFRRDDPRGRFLRRSRDGACRWFRGVLSPDYNAAHADHLHLDRGPWAHCR